MTMILSSVALHHMGFGVRVRPPMITVDRRVEAPADSVWNVLVDLDAWPRWGPSVTRAALDSGGRRLAAGSRGRVWTPPGLSLPFAVTEFDEGRCWAWSVGGVPATAHGVVPTPGGSRVWFAVPWWAAPYVSVCALALSRIEKLAVTRT
jgi:hypothetical protein